MVDASKSHCKSPKNIPKTSYSTSTLREPAAPSFAFGPFFSGQGLPPKPRGANQELLGVVKHLLGQWLNFKLLGITYLVGKIKFKLLFQGPLAK